MANGKEAVVLLRGGGVSVAIDTTGPVPTVLHWGEDLGPLDADGRRALALTGIPAVLNNAPDSVRTFTLWPTERDGWSGTPAQRGHAEGMATTPRPALDSVIVTETEGVEGGTAEFHFVDAVTAIRGRVRLELDRWGVLSMDMEVSRDAALNARSGAVPYTLDGLVALMPIPDRATELLDFTGKWCRERDPQRSSFDFGTHARSASRGKSGHDSPFLLMAGTGGFGFGHGEVWASHVAWSGNQIALAERLPEGAGALSAVLGGGERLAAGEVRLAHGESYIAPTVLFVWSADGMDGLTARLHSRMRGRASHPKTPRPLILNTWEAVYFDHGFDRLSALVGLATDIGVERLVLDDGWFQGRRDDRAGLGDWFIDPVAWPDGLAPFSRLLHDRGMEFGLWFEPEMINLDSQLAREHPDWILGPSEGLGPTSRNQYVLDIARPEVFAYLLERIDALVSECGIDYIKWDHNRDLLEAVAQSEDGDRPTVHAQTVALYRMLDELRLRHPKLEIETCSGGGGRVDLGILDRTDRVWPSDCNDPVERTRIERWTSVLIPPELIGSHIGSSPSHTTGRATSMSFRLAAALGGHAGIELDLTQCSDDELRVLTAWAAMYKDLRGLLHSGRTVNADLPDGSSSLSGVVAQDGSSALYRWIRAETSAPGQSGRVRIPGLKADASYRLRLREELGAAMRHEVDDPAWVVEASRGWIALPGALLVTAGLPLPTLAPEQAMLIEVERL